MNCTTLSAIWAREESDSPSHKRCVIFVLHHHEDLQPRHIDEDEDCKEIVVTVFKSQDVRLIVNFFFVDFGIAC